MRPSEVTEIRSVSRERTRLIGDGCQCAVGRIALLNKRNCITDEGFRKLHCGIYFNVVLSCMDYLMPAPIIHAVAISASKTRISCVRIE